MALSLGAVSVLMQGRATLFRINTCNLSLTKNTTTSQFSQRFIHVTKRTEDSDERINQNSKPNCGISLKEGTRILSRDEAHKLKHVLKTKGHLDGLNIINSINESNLQSLKEEETVLLKELEKNNGVCLILAFKTKVQSLPYILWPTDTECIMPEDLFQALEQVIFETNPSFVKTRNIIKLKEELKKQNLEPRLFLNNLKNLFSNISQGGKEYMIYEGQLTNEIVQNLIKKSGLNLADHEIKTIDITLRKIDF